MSNIHLRNRTSTALPRKRSVSSNWGTGVKVRRPVPAPATPLLDTLPQRRREKVLAIRQQIAEGTYDPGTRINAILDRLLKVLVA